MTLWLLRNLTPKPNAETSGDTDTNIIAAWTHQIGAIRVLYGILHRLQI